MWKTMLLGGALALTGVLSTSTFTAQAAPQAIAETPAQHDARLQWFRDARFGMFIHWGLYAQAGGVWNGKKTDVNNCAEWLMLGGRVPRADYATLAREFNPTQFDADAWVRAARDAGMKYVVFTSKHHEGFAMFQTKTDPYNIIEATPFKRDPLRELAAACRKYNIKLGLYYSQNLDWYHPGGGGGEWDPTHAGSGEKYVEEIAIPQLREILTNYGDISLLWFDIREGSLINRERADRIMKMVKELQPNIIVNNRLGGGYEGDYGTPENVIPPSGVPGQDWESCMTINKTWGYSRLDNDWKSGETLIRNLVDIASKGGNLLLNVGPDEKGEIPTPSLKRLAEIGDWMKVNGEAIHSTQASVFPQLPSWGRVTTRLNADGTSSLYAIVFDAPADGTLDLPGLSNSVRGAKLLGSATPIQVSAGESSPRIVLPESQRVARNFVIALTLEGAPQIDTAAHADSAGRFVLSPRQAALTGGLKLQTSELYGLNLGPEENIGYWLKPAGTASWQLRASKAGRYRLKARLAAPESSKGNVIEFVVGDQVVPFTIAPTGHWNSFADNEIGVIDLPAGLSTLTARAKTLNGEALVNLGAIELVPAK